MIQQNVRSTELSDTKDNWTCIWGAPEFKIAAYYTFFFREIIAHDAYKWLWKAKSIPKTKVFGWLLLSDCLITRNMLKRRHYNIWNNLDCLLCGEHVEETVEHLFFRCTFSAACWRELDIFWLTDGNRLEMISYLKTMHHSKMTSILS